MVQKYNIKRAFYFFYKWSFWYWYW